MDLAALDWDVLDRLRATFLSDARTAGPYWHTVTDLECYDATYGERIGWKWDAVLAELDTRAWRAPERPTVLDWGCGSGVAGRRVAAATGAARLFLHDHSPLALEFAEHRARARLPDTAVARADTRLLREGTVDLLVISHVLNELDDVGRAELADLLARARVVLWVEPGTHEVSRALGVWRGRALAAGFGVVAPCTHASACGVLAAGNERHWCHAFAAPPPAIFANPDWVRFGQRACIDLRSLPYAFLALDRRAAGDASPGGARIIGEPRLYKGYAKVFSCDATGVAELTLQQRTDKALFKELKRASGPLLYRWSREGDRITAAQRVGSQGA
jgi:SAM-dependent methyltransferase